MAGGPGPFGYRVDPDAKTLVPGQIEAATPQLPSPEQLRTLCSHIRRVVAAGNPEAVKQLLRDLIDRVEITPDRQAYRYFWVSPAGEPTAQGPRAAANLFLTRPPAPTLQGDAGWLFVTLRMWDVHESP